MHSQSSPHHNSGHIGQLIAAALVPPPSVRYDFSGLGKLAGDAGFVREIQQMFVDRVPGQLAQLEAALEAGDWPSLAQRAHSLKSTFGNLSIEPGTALLKEMEATAGQHPDKQTLLALLQMVTSAAEAVLGAFRRELARAA